MFFRVQDSDTQKRSFFRTEATTPSLSWFIDKINLALFFVSFLSERQKLGRRFIALFPCILCCLPKKKIDG